jgi:hypothetical protein
MEDVGAVATDFLSFQGCRGATLPCLWAHVASVLSCGRLEDISDAMKAALWEHILQEEATFGIFCHEAVEGVTATVAGHVDGVTTRSSCIHDNSCMLCMSCTPFLR